MKLNEGQAEVALSPGALPCGLRDVGRADGPRHMVSLAGACAAHAGGSSQTAPVWLCDQAGVRLWFDREGGARNQGYDKGHAAEGMQVECNCIKLAIPDRAESHKLQLHLVNWVEARNSTVIKKRGGSFWVELPPRAGSRDAVGGISESGGGGHNTGGTDRLQLPARTKAPAQFS